MDKNKIGFLVKGDEYMKIPSYSITDSKNKRQIAINKFFFMSAFCNYRIFDFRKNDSRITPYKYSMPEKQVKYMCYNKSIEGCYVRKHSKTPVKAPIKKLLITPINSDLEKKFAESNLTSVSGNNK